jgi:flagellar FliL protein
MAKAEKDVPAKSGKKNLLVLGIVGLLSSAAGFALPLFVNVGAAEKGGHADEPHKTLAEFNYAFVPFGEVVVNPNEERFPRFLRVKLTLLVDPAHEKQVSEGVGKQKPILKNWLISYLSDKSMKDMTGGAGINRARREIQDQFNTLLFPDGSEKIRDVLVEEFNFQ